MPTNSSRHIILQKIVEASKRRLPLANITSADQDEIYRPILPDAITCFKNELEAIKGQCILCEDELALYTKLRLFILKNNFSYLYCLDSYIADRLKVYDIPFSKAETDFESMEAGVTGCEFLVARTGSVLVSAASKSGRQMNVFPPVHIVLAHVSQLVHYPEDALVAIQKKYRASLPSSISTITGPSRTADIEKTLVLGAHGPKEFVVFLCKE
ncbi:MAG: lactate utilization protein [Bacteroidota bacterium]|nr:lactate utilization protein [Bacteroidota bacterium]